MCFWYKVSAGFCITSKVAGVGVGAGVGVEYFEVAGVGAGAESVFKKSDSATLIAYAEPLG